MIGGFGAPLAGVMDMKFVISLLLLGACFADPLEEDGPEDKINGGNRRALFYPNSKVEGNYAVTSTRETTQLLAANQWTTQVAPVSSWEDLFQDMDKRIARGETYDLIVTVSHAGYHGPMFGGQLPFFSNETEGNGVGMFARRTKALLVPDGTVMFSGCKTGRSDGPSVDDGNGREYKTFANAIAHQSGRRALGTKYSINLGHTRNFMRAFFYESGEHREWLRVEPTDNHFRDGARLASNAALEADEPSCGLGDPGACDADAWYDDVRGCCDPCVTDDPDCSDVQADVCPETWRADPMGVCDECLGDDPDCLLTAE